MGMPSKGTIVTINFPFSDLSSTKRRPALVLASVKKGDVILCQITSKPYSDPAAIVITANDFNQGTLNRESFARPGKLFTAHQSIARKLRSLKQKNSMKLFSGYIKFFREKGNNP